MSKIILRAGLVIVLAAGVSSCVGGSGGQPLQESAVSTVLTQLNTVLGKLPRNGAGTVTPPVPNATTSAVGGVHASAIDCETVTPTPIVDIDADNIAALKTSTFDCTELTVGGSKYTRQGKIEVKDADDTKAGAMYGLSVEFAMDALKSVNIATSETTDQSFTGYWRYIQSGSTLTSVSQFDGVYKFVGGTNSTYNFVTNYKYSYSWDWLHTPDNSGAPWTTGTESFKGTFSFDGMFSVEDGNGVHSQGNGKFVLKYYSKNTLFDSNCTKWFKSGSIFIDDGNSSTFEIRYNCSDAKLYINGAASDLWTP